MPSNWTKKSEKKEKAWKEAKTAFKKSYGREPEDKKDFAIIMSIAKKMLK